MLTFLAQAATDPEANGCASVLLAWAPMLLFVPVILWLTVRLSKRTDKLNERGFEHQRRVQAQNDEMIALLKDIRDRLDARKP